jgi:hypothetical protein
MLRNSWLNSVLAALAALFVVQCSSVHAQTVPFRVSGAGTAAYFPFPGEAPAAHNAAGTATHLGAYLGLGSIQTLTVNPLTGVGTFQSATPFVFNGKAGTLAFNYGRTDQGAPVGVFQLIPAGMIGGQQAFIAAFDAIFTLAEPTSTVSAGQFRMIAVSEPFVPGMNGSQNIKYMWKGEGSIRFGQ